MRKEIIHTSKAPAPAGQYSQAVKLGNLVYVAGTCPFEIGTYRILYPGDIREQTNLVFQYIQAILQAAGTSLEHTVKVVTYLSDLNHFNDYNQAYAAFFPANPPARVTVEIGKFPKDMLIEIECTAYIPGE